MAVRIIQLTDLHLLADPQARLRGVPTTEAFLDVVNFIRHREEPFDFLVITGDLAHDEQLQTYQRLRELLGDWLSRCLIIPGNHDNRHFLQKVFPEITPPGAGPVIFSLNADNWQLIGLDSHVPGEVSGRIDAEQLAWLKQELAACDNRPALLFLHHPPFSVDSPWLDRIGLQQPEELLALVTSGGPIRIICTGHVHHQFERQLAATRLMTTPSTAFQFDPTGEESASVPLPPGFRTFVLDHDDCRSDVVRLPDLHFPPVAESGDRSATPGINSP